jgi:hypothetical protein
MDKREELRRRLTLGISVGALIVIIILMILERLT